MLEPGQSHPSQWKPVSQKATKLKNRARLRWSIPHKGKARGQPPQLQRDVNRHKLKQLWHKYQLWRALKQLWHKM
jgi:hypothetical protein